MKSDQLERMRKLEVIVGAEIASRGVPDFSPIHPNIIASLQALSIALPIGQHGIYRLDHRLHPDVFSSFSTWDYNITLVRSLWFSNIADSQSLLRLFCRACGFGKTRCLIDGADLCLGRLDTISSQVLFELPQHHHQQRVVRTHALSSHPASLPCSFPDHTTIISTTC